MKLIFTTSVLIIFSTFFLPAIFTLFMKDTPNNFQPSLQSTQAIYKDIAISQSFISEKDNLSGIGMSIKNPYFRNKKDVILKVYDEGHNHQRTIVINGINIADGSLLKFKFDPVKNSANKQFSFELLAPNVDNQGESSEVFLTYTIPSWSRGLYINNDLTEGSISFFTLHRSANPIQSMFDMYKNWFYKLTKDPVFSIVYFAIVIGLIISLRTKFRLPD